VEKTSLWLGNVSGLGNEKSEVLRALLTKKDLNNLLIGV